MSCRINFIAKSISHGTMHRSQLPWRASRICHTLNNLASEPHTKLLYIGGDISYALCQNSNIDTITWFDDFDSTKLNHTDLRPEYNLIVGKQDVFCREVISGLKDRFGKRTILATVHAQGHDNRDMEKTLLMEEGIRVVSRTTVFDEGDVDGWGDGLTLYDIDNKAKHIDNFTM
ncbi:hypothetical protein ATCV1_Z537L [Acanthocystis turfacea chlorella virus 1]|uniref:Uncharacterized protein Z537L n=1 Tax=Chlorovirus heliozoae TaxID=322019 RepID=A7K9E7_9PHYC|nr:hypothetical protein ATCV1_Z537L [Acanthocystis turfacea chlorella virus 1]ABT16671.1 hypothetical protein ATCV1_Z537L [Acanthocystis turfacea chlorella virus 1]AGE60162.1 hypothetical protein ATCVWI0606_644L [Acanthocystis turfacea Chlorella virus WI0606]